MKKAFHNMICLDKLRIQLIKKNVVHLLLLTTIAALFATATAACVTSNTKDVGSQLHITSAVVTSHLNQSRAALVGPLISLRMLDKTHGWALTTTSVLKTSDAGYHWDLVTPPDFPGRGLGTFMNQNEAWIASMTEQGSFIVEHTSDGGKHWHSSSFSDGSIDKGGITDPPHFINPQDGWLDVQRDYTMGDGITANDIFYTTDGGSHWTKLATAEQITQNGSVAYNRDTGISVKDAQNIWDTKDSGANMRTGAYSQVPEAFVTYNGGKSWQQQTLPTIAGLTNTSYSTTPPVFFGNYALMPVKVTSITSGNTSLSIYVTNDGGVHWSNRAKTSFDAGQVYIVDPQHIWVASLDGSIHASTDGGKSWHTLESIGKIAASMSFTDASSGWIITEADEYGNGSQLLHTVNGGQTWQQIHYSIQ